MPGAFSQRARYDGEFEFTDGDGDSQTSSPMTRVRLVGEVRGSQLVTSCAGEFLNKPGVTSGKIQFSGTTFARVNTMGPITVWVSVVDAAGNPGNALKATISNWWQ